ncbi:LysM peptidoglycan-binding domain-containing protein [bacterium]|nr:LysM peptidoglycan-binding domain-containing protein [bacterium]
MKNLVQKESCLLSARIVSGCRVVFIFCIVLASFIIGNASAYAQNTSCHTVRSGETLTSIAARYGTTVSVIMRTTGISNANSIRVGQQLCFVISSRNAEVVVTVAPANSPPQATATPAPAVGTPTGTAPTRAAPTGTAPTGTAPTRTAPTGTAPTGTAPTRTAPTGTAPTRAAPTPTVAPRVAPTQSATVYIVRRGDSLLRISSLYGVSVSQLMAYNGLTSTTIYTGQTIRIPSR